MCKGTLDVEGADDPVLGDSEGQIHDRCRSCLDVLQALPVDVARVRAFFVGWTQVGTIFPRFDRRQHSRQGANRGRLSRAAIAEQQDTTYRAVDRSDEQRQFHLLLADDSREREDGRSGH
jgi:hypothetical protein